MSNAPSFVHFPDLSSPEDDAHFNPLWDFGFGQQQELSRSPYFTPVNSQMDVSVVSVWLCSHSSPIYQHTDHPPYYVGQDPPGQPQFSGPGFGAQDDFSKNMLPRLDTRVFGTPRVQISSDPSSSTTSAGSMMPLTPYWGGDNHLQVHAPPITPSSPSATYPYISISPTVCLGTLMTLIIDD
jgi:hypothetical protein